MDSKFKIEVQADSSGKWAGNAMVYDTFEDARTAARDLAGRWMLVTAARVVEFDPAIEADHDPLANRHMDSTINTTVVF